MLSNKYIQYISENYCVRFQGYCQMTNGKN